MTPSPCRSRLRYVCEVGNGLSVNRAKSDDTRGPIGARCGAPSVSSVVTRASRITANAPQRRTNHREVPAQRGRDAEKLGAELQETVLDNSGLSCLHCAS